MSLRAKADELWDKFTAIFLWQTDDDQAARAGVVGSERRGGVSAKCQSNFPLFRDLLWHFTLIP